VSPKKTWEGTIGGALLAVVAVVLLGRELTNLSYQTLVIVSATAAITGTIGDLIESKFKRMAGVKDSGNILPGHGGFFDRFDSLLLAGPSVWLMLTLFTQ
jgi:phosphatidate cytidylyltransferase